MHEIELANKVLKEAKKSGAKKFIKVEVGELSEITPKELEEGLKKISRQSFDAKILDKPRTSVHGESWTSKNPNKLRTLVRSKTQGFFDINSIKSHLLEHEHNPQNHEHDLDVNDLMNSAKIAKLLEFDVYLKESRIKCSCGYDGRAKILDRGHGYCIFNCPKCGKNPEVLEGGEIKIIEIA